jgi:hypothetical protein
MKSKIQLAGILSLLAAVPGAFAQSTEPPKPGNIMYMQTTGPGPADNLKQTFAFVSSEMSFDGNVVKNAPYSAEALTETTQTLPDGNHISRKGTASLYRDSEGRTRREEAIGAIGPWSSPGAQPSPAVFINDPVSNTNTVLDSRNKTARRMPSPKIQQGSLTGGAVGTSSAGAGGAAVAEAKIKMKAEMGHRVVISQSGAGDVGFASMAAPAIQTFVGKESENVQKESLGKQLIEGVQADGTRTTMTIPAGAIGNDLPIQIVSERWYSPDLQTVVMSKHSDPRMGETTYRLTNISRSEPSPSLFQVPADYTVTDAKPMAVRLPDE